MTDSTTTDRVGWRTLVLSSVAIGGFIAAELLSPGLGAWVVRAVGLAALVWLFTVLRRVRTA